MYRIDTLLGELWNYNSLFRRKMKTQTIVVVVIIALAAVFLGYQLFYHDGQKSEYKEIDLEKTVSPEELRRIKEPEETEGIVFGFDLRRSVKEDIRQYIPFLKYLGEATGYKFKLRFTPKDASIVDDLGKGIIQIAAVGADTYITVHKKYGAVILVRGLNKQNEAEYQSVLITAPDSNIHKIEDIKGKKFAFGSLTSTQGHLIPRIVLAQHGITLDDLAKYEWTGSHRNCANAISAGRFDVGGMQDVLGRELADAGIIRIFHTSKYYPSSGIATNKDVPPEIIAKVKKALLGFDPTSKHAEGLYNWDKTEMPNGFKEAKDEDYDELRKWAMKLGLIE